MATAEQILDLGDDQLKDQFLLRFPAGIPGGGNAEGISLRMDETFDPPEESVNVYEIFHKGQKITRPGGAEETDKSIEFVVRLDQQWQVWDDLKAWKDLVYDVTTGTPGVGTASRAPIAIEATGREADVPVKTLLFTQCSLVRLDIQEFDHSSGEPLKLNLGLTFLRMNVE
jgi:hypothetical protein